MGAAAQHEFQVLTKRPRRLAKLLSRKDFSDLVAVAADRDVPGWASRGERPWPLPNVWIGTSIESDEYCWRADELRRTPAAIRFLPLEPLLGPLPSLDLTELPPDVCESVLAGLALPGSEPIFGTYGSVDRSLTMPRSRFSKARRRTSQNVGAADGITSWAGLTQTIFPASVPPSDTISRQSAWRPTLAEGTTEQPLALKLILK
jgi:Protein of unknown function (DUF5131)